MGEKTQRIEPMVERDDEDAARGKTRAVIARLGAGADDKPAAVNPDHRRQARAIVRGGRRPNIEIKAILGDSGGARVDVVEDDALQRIWPEGVDRAHAGPGGTGCGGRQRKRPDAAGRHRECPCKRARRLRPARELRARRSQSTELSRQPGPPVAFRVNLQTVGASAFRRARQSARWSRAPPRCATPRSISPSVRTARTSRPSVARRPSRSQDERSTHPRSPPNAPRRSCPSRDGEPRHTRLWLR